MVDKTWSKFKTFTVSFMTSQVIKDWMLVIVVAVVVALDMVILLVGTAVPESRLTANATLVEELRQNVQTSQ